MSYEDKHVVILSLFPFQNNWFVQGEQGSEWVSPVCPMTKRQCSRLGKGAQYGKCGHGAAISSSHQLPRLPCRGVRTDKEQEVRGNCASR